MCNLQARVHVTSDVDASRLARSVDIDKNNANCSAVIDFAAITSATGCTSGTCAGGEQAATRARSASIDLAPQGAQHNHVQRLPHDADDAEATANVPKWVVE